ncbi:MAG: 3'-5' exonuclease [Cyanobacteria bacterium J06643_4]
MAEELKEYKWWVNDGAPPEHFKTKRQLSEMGLKPVSPVGVIHTNKYDCLLYDSSSDKSVRKKHKATPAQLAALEKGRKKQVFWAELRQWDRYEGFIYDDIAAAIQEARRILSNQDNYVVLDTETTGLGCRDQVVEIAIIDLTGKALIDTLVKPIEPVEMKPGASAVYKIAPSMLKSAPTLFDLRNQIEAMVEGKTILAYNSGFDIGMIRQSLKLEYSEKLFRCTSWLCLMELYAEFCGEWSNYHKSYRWQPLYGGNHRALDAAKAALARLKDMAKAPIVYGSIAVSGRWTNAMGCKPYPNHASEVLHLLGLKPFIARGSSIS